eukprot:TRINITY_DN1386_c0_g1_i1.p1 TRINITY_DN1386_c0_g1~~TRINITY_DN1386_c0_g1_i1.p1  ORF type:complete len:318 (+),score=44.57 TRINITY_DN1386_c0_g1_i1:175-1128(+)
MSRSIVRVHFMDSSVKAFAIDPAATAETLLKTVIERLELKEAQCFALFEKKDDWERCLEADEKPCDLMKAWTSSKDAGGPKFLFKKKIFIRDDDKELNDPVAKNLLYMQAVHNVVHSIYRCTAEEAIKLAGLQVHIVYGDHNSKIHVPGFLPVHGLKNFIPKDLYSSKRPAEWETYIFKEHGKHKGRSKEEAQTMYLNVVKKWAFYGTTFYPPCKTINSGRKLPNKVIIGVNAEGILLLKPKDKSVISTHPFTEICSWASSSSTFAFEFGTQADATKYTFETKQGAIIAATIQTYIDILVDMLTNNPGDDESSTATD